MKKRILSIFLAAALLCGLLPMGMTAVFASEFAYFVEGGNLYFDCETGTITDCDGSVTGADIPAEISGVKVTAIGDSAFFQCNGLTSVRSPAA